MSTTRWRLGVFGVLDNPNRTGLVILASLASPWKRLELGVGVSATLVRPKPRAGIMPDMLVGPADSYGISECFEIYGWVLDEGV